MSIQGQTLEVTVVSCSNLKDTEWISRQDPYVCLEYATTKFRTRTCTDGGKNPMFQEKLNISLIEGLREISVAVWNSNTISQNDFIGNGRILLHKVISQGYDDSSWPIQSRSGRFAGEVKVIMYFSDAGNSEKPGKSIHMPNTGYHDYHSTTPPHYPAQPYVSPYMPSKSVDTTSYSTYPPATPYPAAYPPVGYPAYPPADSAPYAPPVYPPPSAMYPPNVYPPNNNYPPNSTYPPQPYPPPPAQPCYPPAPYPGYYPPY